MSEVIYADHDGQLWSYDGCTLTNCTFSTLTTNAFGFSVRRRTRWQHILHALSLPLRVRLVVRP